jgi:hypothetical protein
MGNGDRVEILHPFSSLKKLQKITIMNAERGA